MTTAHVGGTQIGCVLSQQSVAKDTDESKTASAVLKELVLKGRIVIGDAIFCQRDHPCRTA